MNNGRNDKSELLGFEKTPINYFFLGMCIFPFLLFVWDALIIVKHPFIFSLLNSVIIFCGAVGILLYVNRRWISGILGIVGQLVLYAFTRFFYRMNLIKDLYFWIFVALLIYFIVNYLTKKNQRRSGIR